MRLRPHGIGLLGLFLLSSLVVGSCDEAPEPRDAGSDAGACVPTVLEEGTAVGAPDPLSAEPGQARAGRLDDVSAFDVPGDLSVVAAGDFVLANGRIAVVIEDVGASDGFDPWGGKPVALARVRGGAIEPANFNESIPMLGRFIPEVRSVTIVNDGLDGEPAVVRAIGSLVPIPAFDVLFAPLLNDDMSGVDVAVDYTLAPDADHLSVDLTFATDRPRRARQPMHVFFQTTRMPAYLPGGGFDTTAAPTDLPWIGFVGDEGVSYALRSPEGPLRRVFEVSGGSIFSSRAFVITGCGADSVPFAELHIAGGGLDGLLTQMAALDGVARAAVTGIVQHTDGTPAPGVRVIAEDDDGGLNRARTGADGRYRLDVPETSTTTIRVWRPSSGFTAPVEVVAGVADVSLPAVGHIAVSVTDMATGDAMPARIQVLAESPPEPPIAVGEPGPTEGRLVVEYATDGTALLEVPPGDHSVVVSRGFEWDLVRSEVTVRAGETLDLEVSLSHLRPSPGVLCGDFHLHTHRSIDAGDEARGKVAAAVAEGVEIPVRTEHEWVADFEPVIADMGLEEYAYGVAGLELTTFLWGHFGAFPLVVDPALPSGGFVPSAGRLAPDVLAEARTRGAGGSAAVVIHHPRSFNGLMNEGAYFDAVGYDPDTGAVERADLWDESFVLLEAFNASDFDANFSGSVRDWFSFLDAGRRVFAMGSSDSHQVVGTPIGYPRTCVELGVDDAAGLRALGPAVLREAMESGHSVVNGGISVEVLARGDLGPGGEVTGSADRESVQVVVAAPPWIDVDQLRVYVDGALLETVAIDSTTTDPLDASIRLSANIEVPVDAGPLGSWVVFVASGDAPLEPLYRRMPFGVTNPIFFLR